MNALCKVNGISLNKEEMIKLSQEVENKYIGVNSGTLDSYKLICEEYKSIKK